MKSESAETKMGISENLSDEDAPITHYLESRSNSLMRRKIQAELDWAIANMGPRGDEATATMRVAQWMLSQLPRLFQEIEAERLQENRLQLEESDSATL